MSEHGPQSGCHDASQGAPVVLVGEAEPALARELTRTLRNLGCVAFSTDTKGHCLSALATNVPSLLILGSLGGDDLESLSLLRTIVSGSRRRLRVALLAQKGTENLAVSALRAGAWDYLSRDSWPADLPAALIRLRSECAIQAANADRGSARDGQAAPRVLSGTSESIRGLQIQIGRVAAADCNVLITGETGTGKEIVAEEIHRRSARAHGPFVGVNCAALPEGLLESELFGYEKGAFTGAERLRHGRMEAATGGTLFLDEIGDLHSDAQAKLLRAIEQKEIQRLGTSRSSRINVRIIAATNRTVHDLLDAERLRRDLYYRLSVAHLDIPCLRERKEDLAPLCSEAVADLNRRYGAAVEGVTEEAFAVLLRHNWPGNVRELRNVLEAAFIGGPGPVIDVADLPELRGGQGEVRTVPELSERDKILLALRLTRWNKSRTAEQLHWSRMTLYRKMARYHIPGGGPGAPASTRCGRIPAGAVAPTQMR